MSFFKSKSFKSGIIQSVILNIFSKAVTFLNTILITFYFGVSLQTDIYYYIFSVIALVAGFITVINGAVIIPEAIRLREQVTNEAAMKYINKYAFWHSVIGIIISIFVFTFSEHLFLSISRFNAIAIHQYKNIIGIIILLLPLMIITQHLKDILAMYKYFTLPIVLTLINSISSITFLIIFSQKGDLVYAVYGLLLGYIISIVFMGYILFNKIKWKVSIKSYHIEKSKESVYLWYFSNLISIPCASFYLYLIPSMGSGYLTAYSLALQISLIPVQFIILQMISIIAIKFNELYAKNDKNQINLLFNYSTDITLFSMCVLATLLLINSSEVINILFRRGNFNEDAVVLTSNILRLLSLTIPFTVLASFTSVLLMASQQVKKAFIYQVSANLFLVLVSSIGFYFSNVKGFLIGLIIYHVVNNILMKYLFMQDLFIEYQKALKKLFLYLLLCIGIGSLIILLFHFVSIYNLYIQLFAKSILFISLLLAITYLLSLNKVFFSEIVKLFSYYKNRN